MAERYASDVQLSVGEVVIFGGSEEITRCARELSDAVFGVVSDSPAFLIDASTGHNDSHPMITPQGQVTVQLN